MRIQEPDKRLSWGLALSDGRHVVRIFVERDNSRALEEARTLAAQFPNFAETEIIGRAQASAKAEKRKTLSKGLEAGASIGHLKGAPGSIGALIRNRQGKDDWKGVTSAAHVLGRSNRAKEGDQILAPGHPDGPKVSSNKCGTLDRYNLLTHVSDEDTEEYLCCSDLAVVKLDGECRLTVPQFTTVVHPSTKDRQRLKGQLSTADAVAHLGKPVHKVGRTSDLTSGTLDVVGLQRQAILLPDQRLYYYSDVLVVDGGRKPFSHPGDSGALVYSDDFHALGFVIGGAGNRTFVAPIETCLDELEVELVL